MARPTKLNKPRTINVIVEEDIYHDVLKTLPDGGFSEYIRELMVADQLINTSNTIKEQIDKIADLEHKLIESNLKIIELSNTIRTMKKKPSQKARKGPTMEDSLITQVVPCPACKTANIVLKHGKGRKCRSCGFKINPDEVLNL